MSRSIPGLLLFLVCGLVLLPLVALAQNNSAPPQAGPRATVLTPTNVYISPDKNSSRVGIMQPGREMVIAESTHGWLRVFANTDIEQAITQDAPEFGRENVAQPISGWVDARGTVQASTPNGDHILFGAAATFEVAGSDPHPPANAAQSARLLYRRCADLFPGSSIAPEAAWRSADIRWQIQKSDVSTLPSAHEKQAYLRPQLNEDELKKIIKQYSGTRWADLAAYDLLDNKLCGDWQGSTQCPEKESDLYEKYVKEAPDSPKAPQALYNIVYRQCVLHDMYAADDKKKKADEAGAHAEDALKRLTARFPQSDYAARSAALVYKMEQGIVIYGTDHD